MIEVEGLEKSFGANRVLDGITLRVAEGEVVCVIGPSGSGKSTLLRCLNRMHETVPTARVEGRVLLDGRDLADVPAHRLPALGLVQVPEGRRIFGRLTVMENLRMGAFSRSDGEDAVGRDLERVFELFPRLRERRDQLGGTLSGGEQQMLAIGRALMTNPKLLILDEATEGLAPLVRGEIWACLARLKAEDGQSILLIDKTIDALGRIADRHVILEKGRVVWRGDTAALRADETIKHRYLGV